MTGGVLGGGGAFKGVCFVMNHKFDEIISLDNLLGAWEEFAREKKKRADVRIFARALLHNILSLQRDLTKNSYRHSSYEAFQITDPKPRSIHKATVRDRLLHRAVYRVLYPEFDRTFIHDSYSCRDKKGTHKAFRRLVKMARTVSRNYTGPCWAIKMDIRKFFDSVDHEILMELLGARIADRRLLALLGVIIDSFHHTPGKGMPLGNLTSQLFANVYLDPLDKFVKHRLRARFYLRYADDFLIVGPDADELLGYFVEIHTFLKEKLKLSIHPDKVILRKLGWGIDFVGYVALPHYQLPRRKTVRRIVRAVQAADAEQLSLALPSYLGYLQHAQSYRLMAALQALPPTQAD